VVNLLLEGDDLEALLLRAHREGGTAARIVRAEKVRRGGILGFFAKEGFEVAVEIPKDAEPDGEAAQAAEQWAGEFAAPAVDLMPPLSPAPPGSEGLLGLADRASIAEQAATRAITRANTQAVTAAAAHDELPTGASPAERLVAKLVPSRAVPSGTAPIDAVPIDAIVVDAMRVRAMIAGLPSPEPDPSGPDAPDEAIVVHAVAFTPIEFPHIEVPHNEVPHNEIPHNEVPHNEIPHNEVPHTEVPYSEIAEATVAPIDQPRTEFLQTEFPVREPQSLGQIYSVSEHGSLNEATPPTDLPEVTEPFAGNDLSLAGKLSEPPPVNRAPVDILDLTSKAITTTIGPRGRSRRAVHRAVPAQRSARTEVTGTDPGEDELRTEPVDDSSTDPVEGRLRTEPVDDSTESSWQLLRSWRPATRKHSGAHSDNAERPDELANLDQLLRANQVLNRARTTSPDHVVDPDELLTSERSADTGDVGRHDDEDLSPDRTYIPDRILTSHQVLNPDRILNPDRTLTSEQVPNAQPVPAGELDLNTESALSTELFLSSEPALGTEPALSTEPLQNTEPVLSTGPEVGVWSATAGPDATGLSFAGAATRRSAPAGPELIEDDVQLAADRQALRALGVPPAWTENLHAGDRFSSIVAMLDQLPEPRIRTGAAVIAVVGPAEVVELEAHRTALDLPTSGRPRAVTLVPGAVGIDRRSAIARSKRIRPVVVSVPIEGYDDPEGTRKLLASVNAEAVIVIVDASRPIDEITRWVQALEQVDAIALEGGLDTATPAAVLGLDVPVIRVDGIAVDRIGWAALLCAQLSALDASR
jgi:hypothetical protein